MLDVVACLTKFMEFTKELLCFMVAVLLSSLSSSFLLFGLMESSLECALHHHDLIFVGSNFVSMAFCLVFSIFLKFALS